MIVFNPEQSFHGLFRKTLMDISSSFLNSYWSAGLGNFFRYWNLLPIGWRIMQNLHQRRRKTTNTAPTDLVQHKQQANPLISMHNYTPLVIRGNFKNKQLTLSSHCKLALSRKKYTFWVIKSLEHQFKKCPRPLFRPKTNHICHQ